MVARSMILLFFLTGSLLAQSTAVSISDNDGNHTTGTINNGNVYFQDSNGHTAMGTIRNGNVYLSSSNGEATIGTIKNGNVLLNDSKGATTGTIRNGQIFLNNSDGSITTGTYDTHGNVHTNTSPAPQQQEEPIHEQQERQLEQEHALKRQQEINRQNYEAGAAVGRTIGTGIAAAIDNHHINAFCKANPTSIYHANDGIAIPCPNSPLDFSEQRQIDDYCRDNPGLWIEIGKHRVDCLTPPNPPTSKWASWELKSWEWDFTHQKNKVVVSMSVSSEQLRENWEYWRRAYCEVSPSASYKDLVGKKQRCD